MADNDNEADALSMASLIEAMERLDEGMRLLTNVVVGLEKRVREIENFNKRLVLSAKDKSRPVILNSVGQPLPSDAKGN